MLRSEAEERPRAKSAKLRQGTHGAEFSRRTLASWREVVVFGSRAHWCWAILVLVLGACDHLPGKPLEADRYVRPGQVKDFAALYGENCAGCHGDAERPGASIALSDPVYLAVADDEAIRRATAQGVPGTAMPGFARSAGGTLTDEQVEILVRGMRTHWGKDGTLAGAPPYAAAAGDAAHGAEVFAARCASCHGAGDSGGTKGGSVIDGSYLALVSDQGLRTAVIVGRPRLGMPDWRGAKPGESPALSAGDVADVVAWLSAKRPQYAGQPYQRAE